MSEVRCLRPGEHCVIGGKETRKLKGPSIYTLIEPINSLGEPMKLNSNKNLQGMRRNAPGKAEGYITKGGLTKPSGYLRFKEGTFHAAARGRSLLVAMRGKKKPLPCHT
jgi:hypothetical protein